MPNQEMIDSVEHGFVEAFENHREALWEVERTSHYPAGSFVHKSAVEKAEETERVLNLARQQMGVLYLAVAHFLAL